MRDLRTFVEEVEQRRNITLKSNSIRTHKKSKYILLQKKRRKCFLRKKKKNFIFKSNVLTYKNRFCFFLLMKKAREANFLKKDSLSILGSTKNSPKSILLRLNFNKLKKLFLVKKFDYTFQNYNLKNSLTSLNMKKDKINLLNLNKALCKSLHHFTGFEDIHLKIYSTQLNFLPSFKLYQQVLHKKLFFFQRNKDLKKYFSESLETLYFVVGTFGYGNASLLSKLISYMIEDNRKHTQTVRFLKKSLQILFQKMPPNFFAVDGIKILIKGRFNKRRRTKTIVLQQGQISLQTIKTPIDYYQTQAITLYGAFGIKIWLAKRQFY
uniref:30S ribosomal protein S3 n=1 Tax=Nannochloropsis granulata TaxID=43926 RepID=T1R8C7_9STRA|nr:30S ribosomal protein S3 [Nannochloropsis granulata]AGI48919.1 30S ribosomal protein S3 [Nannochloropsis granulata]